MNKKLNRKAHSLVEVYSKIIENILAGKIRYIEERGQDPTAIVVRPAMRKIIVNMEFFSDHVLIVKDQPPVVHGMQVFESRYLDEGQAIYMDTNDFKIDLDKKPTP